MIDPTTLEAYGAMRKTFLPREEIFVEASACHYYHQLISGRVRWTNVDEDGKEILHMMIEAGESFGDLPLFDNGVYAASAIAEDKCEVYRLPKEVFLEMLRKHSDIHFEFSRLFAERLRFKFFVMKEFAYKDPEHRVEALLEYMRKTGKNICPDCTQVKLTRQQIADMTGLRVETVIRAMRNMSDSGKIHIRRGKVYLRMTDVICKA